MQSRWIPWFALAAFCAVFFGLGLLFIPYPGAQYDEVLFVSAIFNPQYSEYAMKFGTFRLPIMLMTYIGTLKAMVYVPILKLLGGTHFALRVPVLLAGAASVGLCFLTLRRLAGSRAAVLASLLLATDTLYLLTCVFDWGPVAFQHVLFTASIFTAVLYAQQQRARWLFLSAFTSGLALWDKALYVWILTGFGFALVLFFPRELIAIARDRRRAAALIGGFVLGALPFLYYNKIHRLRTFTANVRVDEAPVAMKFIMMDRTFDGSGLLGYLVREEPEGSRTNFSEAEKVSLWFKGKLNGPRQSYQSLLLVPALLLVPLLCWGGPWRRLSLTLLTAGAVAYAMMLVTRSAGGSAHHTILLWPIPQLIFGLGVGELVRRGARRAFLACAAATIFCVFSNLTVVNTYLADFIAFGPAAGWTDAIRPLVSELGKIQNHIVFPVDWGIKQQVEFYGSNRIGFDRASDGVVVSLHEPLSQAYLERSLADRRNLFVTHTDGHESFPDVRRKLLEFAAARGYRDEILRVIPDSHGVAIFEIHEFRK